MYFTSTDVMIFFHKAASTESISLNTRINYLCCVGIVVTVNCVSPVGITKMTWCKGSMNGLMDIKLYLDRYGMRLIWPLDPPKRLI